MDFELPDHLAGRLEQIDEFIEAQIRPLETAGDNARFFDHRREFARTDPTTGAPRPEWEIQMRRIAQHLFGFGRPKT